MVNITVQQKQISFNVQQPKPVSITVGGKPISFTVANRNLTYNYNYELIEEYLNGSINNENKIFATTKKIKSDSVRIFQNGLKLTNGIDYEITGENEITFVEAPDANVFEDFLIINYLEDK